MKRISSFIPEHVNNKVQLISKFNSFLRDNFPKDKIIGVEVLNVKNNVLILACRNSSVATIIRFEKAKYLDILESNRIQKIEDIKILLVN